MTNKFRTRVFNLVLYGDDESHIQAIDYIKENYNYAMIKHDKDYDDNGEIKKEHYHVVIKFTNAIYNTSLSKELKIELNYIQKCRDIKASLLYLIHFNDSEKYQYNVDEVFGPLANNIKKYMNQNSKDEDDSILAILEYIENSIFIRYTELLKWSVSNGYYSTLRRGGSLISKCIDEHNGKLCKDLKSDFNDSILEYNSKNNESMVQDYE